MRKLFLLLLLAASQAFASPSLLTSLVWTGVRLYSDAKSSIEVSAMGSGLTQEAAVERALVAAANQAAGSLVISGQAMDNGVLVRDSVIQQSAGVVNHYKVLSCDQDNARYTCTIQATVNTRPLLQEMVAQGAVVDVEGSSLYSQQVTSRERLQNGRRVVMDIAGRITTDGIVASVLSVNQRLTDNSTAILEVGYSIRLNDGYLVSLNNLLAEVERAEPANSVLQQKLGVNVSSSGVGWFGGNHLFTDVTLVNQLQAYLQSKQRLEVRLDFKDAHGVVLGSSCESYRTGLYGNWARPEPYQVKALAFYGRNPELRLSEVRIPERSLRDLSKVEAVIGCGKIATYPSRSIVRSSVPPSITYNGAAVLNRW